MIVRMLQSLTGNESHLVGDGFESRRLLLDPDNPGYFFDDTLLLDEGGELTLEFRHPAGTNDCIEGEGVDCAAGEWRLCGG